MGVPGYIALFGSGEISPTGRKVHDFLFSKLTSPVKVAILETPAGFQSNVDVVALQIKEFIEHSLQNYHPQVEIVKARKKATEFDPGDPKIADLILKSDYIFAGPGSPTYAVRQLKESLVFRNMLVRHTQGAVLSFASAAAIALGSKTLPVYEIFKAGVDLYWEDGLNLFGNFGFDLAIVTHWNNKEGGKKLDTSRCYMGNERFGKLLEILEKDIVVLGIDEVTACIFDFGKEECLVMGKGGVTVIRDDLGKTFESRSKFSFKELN